MKKNYYFNNKLCQDNGSVIDSLLPWKLKGVGVFETIRIENNSIFFFDDHIKRLKKGIEKLGINLEIYPNKIRKQLIELVCLNKMKIARARIAVWKDSKKENSSIVIDFVDQQLEEMQKNGISAVVYPVPRLKERNSNLKSIDYQYFIDAFDFAKKTLAQEALIFNNSGYLTEGSRSNIFIVKNNVVFTPAIQCGGLSGIIRAKIVQLSKEMCMDCVFSKITKTQLKNADEVFITNSIIEILPIVKIDQKKIGNGKVGNFTKKFLSKYKELKLKVL